MASLHGLYKYMNSGLRTKLLAVLLAAMMIVETVPLSAFAEENQGAEQTASNTVISEVDTGAGEEPEGDADLEEETPEPKEEVFEEDETLPENDPEDEPEDDSVDDPEDDPEDDPQDDLENAPQDDPKDDPENDPENDPEDELETNLEEDLLDDLQNETGEKTKKADPAGFTSVPEGNEAPQETA